MIYFIIFMTKYRDRCKSIYEDIEDILLLLLLSKYQINSPEQKCNYLKTTSKSSEASYPSKAELSFRDDPAASADARAIFFSFSSRAIFSCFLD